MLYLAPYTGTGNYHTRDGFRPQGARQFGGAWGSVDLRPDPTKPEGYALVSLDTTADIPGLIKIGEDKAERFAASSRTQLGNRLNLSLPGGKDVSEIVAELLFSDGKKWKHVQPNRSGHKHVYIGGKLWAFKQVAPPINGELVDPTDDFNRADETPIGGNWTNLRSGIRLLSNKLAGAASSDIEAVYRNDFTPANDHFSQIALDTDGGDNDWGVATRMSTVDFSMYFFSVYNGAWAFAKWIAEAFTEIEALTSGSLSATDITRLESAGSTHTCKVNTVANASSPSTDTSLATGRVGVFIYNSAVRLDNYQGADLPAAGGGILRQMMDNGLFARFQ